MAARVTLSIGAATLHPDRQLNLADFIRLSDKALYAVKNSGRHGIQRA